MDVFFSDQVLIIALYATAIASAITVVLILMIGMFRWMFHVQSKRDESFAREWQPILAQVILGSPMTGPSDLSPPRELTLLRLWNYWHESLSGQANDRLKQFALACGCDHVALKLAQRGNRAQQLLSAITLGNFRHEQAWPFLWEMVVRKDQILSLRAARALLQIQPERAIRELLHMILRRQDWELSVLANIIKKSRDAFRDQLVGHWSELTVDERERAFRLCASMNVSLPQDLVQGVLKMDVDVVLLTAALLWLERLKDPSHHSQVSALLNHSHACVRAQAVQTLGALATASDVTLMLEMLHDNDAQTRLLAARGLGRMPGFGAESLSRLKEDIADARAYQAVAIACSEQEVGR